MTRKRNPDTCDFCGNDIDSEMQYCLEVYQGRSTFSQGEQTKGMNMDCCHKCFLEICSHGYKPEWKTTIKNPNWVAGAKKGSGHEYRIPKPESTTQTLDITEKVAA